MARLTMRADAQPPGGQQAVQDVLADGAGQVDGGLRRLRLQPG
jgi:hypothetical protein